MLNKQKFFSTALSVIGFTVLLMSINAVPAGAQKPFKEKQVFEDQYTIVNPCNGELITVTDKWQVSSNTQVDREGCEHWKFHSNNMGTSAVGESGSKYQIPYAANARSVSGDGCTLTETWTNTSQVVGQGKASNFKYSYRTIFTINFCTDPWEYTIIRESYSATCDGEPF